MLASRRGQARRTALVILAAADLAACLDAPADGGSGGDGEGSVQLLANPSFEEASAGWSFEGSVEIQTTDELSLPPSEAGPMVAQLGRATDDFDLLYQEVAVPAWTRRLEVSGIRCFATSEGTDDTYDEFWISIDSIDGSRIEDVVEASNLDASAEGCEWSSFSVATSAHAGEQVRFVVEAQTDDEVSTSFAIDGLALTASP